MLSFDESQKLVGKKLKDVTHKLPSYNLGYMVYILKNKDDINGRFVIQNKSIKSILEQKPNLGNMIIKYMSNHFGSTVIMLIGDNYE